MAIAAAVCARAGMGHAAADPAKRSGIRALGCAGFIRAEFRQFAGYPALDTYRRDNGRPPARISAFD